MTIIDFPQMVSVAHPNAAELFQRDVDGVMRFFMKKLGYMPQHDASLPRVSPNFEVRLGTRCSGGGVGWNRVFADVHARTMAFMCQAAKLDLDSPTVLSTVPCLCCSGDPGDSAGEEGDRH